MTDLTPYQQAAAFHGLATNQSVAPQDRLLLALQALDLYEGEVERLRAQVSRTAHALAAALDPDAEICPDWATTLADIRSLPEDPR